MQIEHDQLQRFIFEKNAVRGEIIRLNGSYQTALSNHYYPDAIGNLLGQSLAAVALLSATIKFKGQLILQTQSDGIVDPLVVQSDEQYHIRGMAKYSDDYDSLSPLLGQGLLAISLIPDDNSERYQGIVNIKENNLATSLEDYFRQSEQLNTRIWLFADGTTAAGIMLQEMPNNDLHFFEHLSILTATLTQEEIFSLPFQNILTRLYQTETVNLFESELVSFKCSCNIKKMENAIKTLGQIEAEEILQGKQVIDVTCEFCNRSYSFDKVDVARIFNT